MFPCFREDVIELSESKLTSLMGKKEYEEAVSNLLLALKTLSHPDLLKLDMVKDLRVSLLQDKNTLSNHLFDELSQRIWTSILSVYYSIFFAFYL
jgi:hypothetical protein